MEEQIIHLKTRPSFQQNTRVNESQVVVDKFIEACVNLDVSIFESYMDEDKDVFEDKDKYRFLEKLHGMFEDYRKATFDDFEVTNITTECKGCSMGQRVEQFKIYSVESAKTIGEFGYLIEIEDGFLKDIYLCNFYSGIKVFYK
jgi:hypothetical protein